LEFDEAITNAWRNNSRVSLAVRIAKGNVEESSAPPQSNQQKK